MVFNISAQRQLTLTQTASQNPLTGGEYRTRSEALRARLRYRSFGQIFSRNLIEQGFGKAALSALQTKQQSVSVQEQALVEVENLHLLAPGLEQIPAEAENLQQTEATQQLEKAAVALKADEQPKEQAPTVATVVSDPIVQKVVEPSVRLPEATTKEQAKPKSFLKSSASTQVLTAAPLGVQLSLFDIGFNPTSATGLKSAPQGVIQAEKEPTLTANQVKESVQSVQETVVTPLLEATSINKVSKSESFISVPSTDSSTLAETVDPMQLFQQVVERVDKRTNEMLVTLQSSSPSLNTLRDWYRAARELNKSQKHLDRISEIGNEFKQGIPLTDKVVTVMQTDFQAYYKQLMVVLPKIVS